MAPQVPPAGHAKQSVKVKHNNDHNFLG